MALKRNLIANYLGQGWTAIMGLVFLPVYIRLLGIESYGLIGFFTLLQAWLALLDMGMTPTLSREMARFTGGARTAESIRDLLRSIEVIAGIIACLIAMGIWLASDWLAIHWLRAETLPPTIVAQAFAIMGVVTALRFVEGIYRSSMVGLQRQVVLNSITGLMATLRGLGAVAVLVWISATIQAFFIWQGVVSLVTLGLSVAITYQSLPAAGRGGRFSLQALLGVARFAAGMIGIIFLSLLLMQVDKVLLSRLLSLSEYGYYTLAAVAAGSLNTLSVPITQAWYPRLTELCASKNIPRLIYTYHLGAQLVSVIMGSAAIVLIVLSETLLLLWTHDAELAGRTARFVSLLALGNLLNGLLRVPAMTQLAYGWTSLAIQTNIVAVAIIIPAILWVTPRYGAEGAAWVWVGLNTSYLFIAIHFMFRRILTGEKLSWYLHDLAQPLFAGLVVALLIRSATLTPTTTGGQAGLIMMTAVATLLAAALAAPLVRNQINDRLSMFLRHRVVRSV